MNFIFENFSGSDSNQIFWIRLFELHCWNQTARPDPCVDVDFWFHYKGHSDRYGDHIAIAHFLAGRALQSLKSKLVNWSARWKVFGEKQFPNLSTIVLQKSPINFNLNAHYFFWAKSSLVPSVWNRDWNVTSLKRAEMCVAHQKCAESARRLLECTRWALPLNERSMRLVGSFQPHAVQGTPRRHPTKTAALLESTGK